MRIKGTPIIMNDDVTDSIDNDEEMLYFYKNLGLLFENNSILVEYGRGNDEQGNEVDYYYGKVMIDVNEYKNVEDFAERVKKMLSVKYNMHMDNFEVVLSAEDMQGANNMTFDLENSEEVKILYRKLGQDPWITENYSAFMKPVWAHHTPTQNLVQLLDHTAESGILDERQALEFIRKGADINACSTTSNDTLLHFAAGLGKENLVDRLLKLKANPKIKNINDETYEDML